MRHKLFWLLLAVITSLSVHELHSAFTGSGIIIEQILGYDDDLNWWLGERTTYGHHPIRWVMSVTMFAFAPFLLLLNKWLEGLGEEPLGIRPIP